MCFASRAESGGLVISDPDSTVNPVLPCTLGLGACGQERAEGATDDGPPADEAAQNRDNSGHGLTGHSWFLRSILRDGMYRSAKFGFRSGRTGRSGEAIVWDYSMVSASATGIMMCS